MGQSKGYEHTISGLIRKRRQMMDEMQVLRERTGTLGNDIESLDRVLETLGHKGDLELARPRSSRTILFHRNELKRFLIDAMRQHGGPMSSRMLAEKIAGAEGKDIRDRRVINELVKRCGKSLKLMREQGVTQSVYVPHEGLMWELSQAR